MVVWKEGDGPSRTINRNFKLKGSEGRGLHVKKEQKHTGQGDIYAHINCCYLQVQQSFKFPVEWKQRVRMSGTIQRSDSTAILEGRYNRIFGLSTLFTGLYIYTGEICSIRFTLQRSTTRLRLRPWPPTMDDIHTLSAHMHASMHTCETHCIISVHGHPHTHVSTTNAVLIMATWGSPGLRVRSDNVCFYQSASSSM